MDRRILALAGTLTLFTPPGLAAQSARDFMTDARSEYEDRMSGIQDYTVSQTSMGFVMTMYFERQEVDGWVAFLSDPSQMTMNGERVGEAMEGQDMGPQMDSNYYMRPEVVDRARIDGSLEVDGNDCWIITIDDVEGLDLGGGAEGGGGFQTKFLRLYMDKDEYIVRRMDIEGTMTGGTGTRDMSTSALMTDYREVEGMVYPFRVEIQTDMGVTPGATSDAGAAAPQPSEIQAMIDQMGDNVSDAERAMIESLLQNDEGGGLPGAMNQGSGPIIVETTELRVNTGPPLEGM